MQSFEVGLTLYILGNLIIIGQSWVGYSKQDNEYRHEGHWAYLVVLSLIASFYLGLALGIAGLVVLLTVYWWLPVIVFLAGHSVFRRCTATANNR